MGQEDAAGPRLPPERRGDHLPVSAALRAKKEMEKPWSSCLFCALDNVSHAECPRHPKLLPAVPPFPQHSGCLFVPTYQGNASAWGSRGEDRGTYERGQKDTPHQGIGRRANPQMAQTRVKEPACSRGIEQECSQAFGSAVG